jgi:hypothetical protein
MPEFTIDAHLDATVEQVWNRLIALDSWSDWNTTHTGFPEGIPDHLRVGTSFKEKMLLMNYPSEVAWTVDGLEPERSLKLSGQGTAAVKIGQTYVLTPATTGGTDVAVDYSVTGIAVRMLGKKIREAATVAVQESLQKLGQLCRA